MVTDRRRNAVARCVGGSVSAAAGAPASRHRAVVHPGFIDRYIWILVSRAAWGVIAGFAGYGPMLFFWSQR